MTTTITNTPANRHVTNAEIEQFFSDNSIDITGKSLSIKRDEDGRIMEVIVDTTMSDWQLSLFKARFFYTKNMVEEIARVQDFKNGNNFSVSLSKIKRYLRIIFNISTLGPYDNKAVQITFNSGSNTNKYSTSLHGIGDSIEFEKEKDEFPNAKGRMYIVNEKTQTKQGFGYYSGSDNITKQFTLTWNNTSDNITSINFKIDSVVNVMAAYLLVEGWN